MWNRLSNTSIEFQSPFELKELDVITKARKNAYILNIYDRECKTGQIFIPTVEHNLHLTIRRNYMGDINIQYYEATIYGNRLMLTYCVEELKEVLKELQDD